jgi:hypothetical protein
MDLLHREQAPSFLRLRHNVIITPQGRQIPLRMSEFPLRVARPQRISRPPILGALICTGESASSHRNLQASARFKRYLPAVSWPRLYGIPIHPEYALSRRIQT